MISLDAFAMNLALQGEVTAEGCQRFTQSMRSRHPPEHAGWIVQQFEVAGANTEFAAAQIKRARRAVHLLSDDALSAGELVKRRRERTQIRLVRLRHPG